MKTIKIKSIEKEGNSVIAMFLMLITIRRTVSSI